MPPLPDDRSPLAPRRFPPHPLLDALARLRAAWPGIGWSWDGRFRCLASSFDRKIAERVREVMADALGPESGAWTAAHIASAPPAVRALADRHGGVRAGQMLLTGAAAGDLRLYALWWPWGDATTISLRVCIENGDREPGLLPRVRALFDIT
jgi:hypothetical protein